MVKKVIDEKDWNFGDEFEYNIWFQGSFNDRASYSFRLNYKDQDSIDGSNKTIMAPVQTANPLNYGGDGIKLYLFWIWRLLRKKKIDVLDSLI